MKRSMAALFMTLVVASGGMARATPLGELAKATVSKLEFGSFKLEVALTALKDWPYPIGGVGVSYRADPDSIHIVVSVKNVPAKSFRTACSSTIGRVREFLYVSAEGVPALGRSYLGAYFDGRWQGAEREAALREIDAITHVRADVVGVASCRAGLVKSPVVFDDVAGR